ncbi:hypothetical protein [Salipaludibacillus daqingensis]|uniref:hypothetical protein n=1 Tax=Salipaludibacillus daqingensis TaxID=3041001 RepID=UPI002473A08E|nr:hypothetical protein [Salipaludibacillus daqingensis]
MNESVQAVSEWLELQKEKTLLITKKELAVEKNESFDEDQVQIQLNRVDVRKIERHDEDGYLSDDEVILHGEGHIHSDKGEVELPQNVFEIPLYGEIITHKENSRMKIETERANYTMIVL